MRHAHKIIISPGNSKSVAKLSSKKLSPTKKKPAKLSLEGTYKVKTNRKIVKKRRSPIFSTPFSARKRKQLANNTPSPNYKSPNRIKRYKLSRVLNPFRIDRRVSPAPAGMCSICDILQNLSIHMDFKEVFEIYYVQENPFINVTKI